MTGIGALGGAPVAEVPAVVGDRAFGVARGAGVEVRRHAERGRVGPGRERSRWCSGDGYLARRGSGQAEVVGSGERDGVDTGGGVGMAGGGGGAGVVGGAVAEVPAVVADRAAGVGVEAVASKLTAESGAVVAAEGVNAGVGETSIFTAWVVVAV